MFGAPKKQSVEARKPFVSTAKKVSTFGAPPPLPGQRSPSPQRVKPPVKPALQPLLPPAPPSEPPPPPEPPVFTTPAPTPLPETDIFSGGSARIVHSVKYLKQSVRWLNLTVSLWSMIVVDANRIVDSTCLSSFLAAMWWRIHGEINEDEFAEMFREWMGRSGVTVPHRYNCSTFVLRDLLLAQDNVESDLDLMLGMVINESNRRLLNTPLNFSTGKDQFDGITFLNMSRPTLELCSRRWLSISEELFFLLDCPGFGFLGFDQFFYFVACLTLAKSEWIVESEAEDALSVTVISAMALQLMKDAGATVCIDTPAADDQKKQNLERRKTAALLRRKSSISSPKATRHASIYRPSSEQLEQRAEEQKAEEQNLLDLQRKLYCGQNSSVVSLVMFKTLLVSRGLSESSLLALVAHIKKCTALLTHVGRKQSSVLLQTCSTYSVSDDEGTIPRPFHRCVYTVAGWPLPSSANHTDFSQRHTEDGVTEKVMSPILLYLLSDVEGLIPGVWLASLELELKLTQNMNNDNSSEVSDEEDESQFIENRRRARKYSEKLTHDVAKKIWMRFSNWGDSAFEPGSKNFFEIREKVADDEQICREPTYRFITSVLSEYKSVLLLMMAGLVDLAMDHFSSLKDIDGGATGGVVVAARTILPDSSNLSAIMTDITKPLPQFSNTMLSFSIANSTLDTNNIMSPPASMNQTNVSFDQPTSSRPSPLFVPPSQNEIKEKCTSPLNALFTSASVDSFHTQNSTNKDEISSVSKLRNDKDESSVLQHIPSFEQEVKMDPPPNSFSFTAKRMEDLDDVSFAQWVNTDDDEKHTQLKKEGIEGQSDSSAKIQSEIKDAMWSSVIEIHDSVDRKALTPQEDNVAEEEEKINTQSSLQASRSDRPDEYVQEQSINYDSGKLSEKSAEFEKREFLRKSDVSDEGSPGGYNSEDISMLSQSGNRFSHPNPDTAERRRSRRKHRQAKTYQNREKYEQNSTQERAYNSSDQRLYNHIDAENYNSSNMFTPGNTPHVKENNMPSRNDENEEENIIVNVSENREDFVKNNMVNSADNVRLSELNSSQNTKHELKEDEDFDQDGVSIASSSSMANSVIELLEKGQSAGIYAQSLRDLLRKMSRGDHNMNLKSLEKIIELGNTIVENEEEASHHMRQQIPGSGGRAHSPKVTDSTPRKRPSKKADSMGVLSEPRDIPRHQQSPNTDRYSRKSRQQHGRDMSSEIQPPSHHKISASNRNGAGVVKESIIPKNGKKRVPGVVPSKRTRTNKQVGTAICYLKCFF